VYFVCEIKTLFRNYTSTSIGSNDDNSIGLTNLVCRQQCLVLLQTSPANGPRNLHRLLVYLLPEGNVVLGKLHKQILIAENIEGYL
jgi:hypothetical protein